MGDALAVQSREVLPRVVEHGVGDLGRIDLVERCALGLAQHQQCGLAFPRDAGDHDLAHRHTGPVGEQ